MQKRNVLHSKSRCFPQFCLKLKTSEIFVSEIQKRPTFLETLLSFLNIFQNLFHVSWMKIFLFHPYFLIVTLLEVQLQVILVDTY